LQGEGTNSDKPHGTPPPRYASREGTKRLRRENAQSPGGNASKTRLQCIKEVRERNREKVGGRRVVQSREKKMN